MNFPALLKAATHAEWLVVTLNLFATASAMSVAKSAKYLKAIA